FAPFQPALDSRTREPQRVGEGHEAMQSAGQLAVTVNAGSSSVRLALWSLEKTGPRRLHSERWSRGELEPDASFRQVPGARAKEDVALVAHRVVHGGRRSQPGVIDGALEAQIVDASKLAP